VLKLGLLSLFGVSFGLLAQEAVPTLPPWASWGVIGTVFGLLMTKQLVLGWVYSDVKTEIKELKAENARLVNLALETQKATLPAIEASTSAVTEALSEIRAFRRT
jgi:hypothetical protein